MADGPQFFQTRMGQRFFEVEIPRIAEALVKLAKAAETLTTPVVRIDPASMSAAGQDKTISAINAMKDQPSRQVIVDHEPLVGQTIYIVTQEPNLGCTVHSTILGARKQMLGVLRPGEHERTSPAINAWAMRETARGRESDATTEFIGPFRVERMRVRT